MATPSELAKAYTADVANLRNMVSDMTPEQLRARPVAGKWSTMEVLAHLADYEPVIAERIQRVVALDNPAILASDENLYAKELFYHERDVETELAVIEAIRNKMAGIIAKLSPEQLARQGVHSVKGPMTLEKIISMGGNHLAHHMKFIAEKKLALGIG